MANQIETFGLNVHMHEGFDYDENHLELRNLIEDSRPIVGLISTPSGPYISKNIATPSDLYEKTKIAWEVLKAQHILNTNAWVLHRMLFPLAFFVVNDGNKLNLILLQTMHYVICHFVCPSYNVGSTTKRKKGTISYNQQHGSTFYQKSYLSVGGKMLMFFYYSKELH
jgi:hypothetical protein